MEDETLLTRQDILELRDGIREDIRDFERRLEQQFAEIATKVVTTVFQLAEALQSRVTDLERSDANLKHRMAMLEERLTELEKRLNLPPQRVQ